MKNTHSRIITAALVCSLMSFAEVADAANVNSYASLQTAINNKDTVNLTGNVTDFSGVLTIQGWNSTINGNSNSIITNTATQMFTVNNGSSLSITNNATLRENNASNSVTLISNSGTFSANNVTFTNAGNSALTNNANATMNLTYATVSGNNTTTIGGAVNNSGKLTATDSTFTKNTATLDGGAIYNVYGAEGDPVIISGVAFGDGTEVNANSAANGGAIYNSGIMTVRSHDENYTNFNFNKASSNGGAVYNAGTGVLTLENNTNFVNNSAIKNGGAVYNAGTLTSTRNNFENNTASENGGAVYNTGSGTVTNGTFVKNTAIGNGGAVYNKSEDKTLTLNTATFGNGSSTGSNSADKGGAVYVSSGTVELVNTTFNYNEATNGGGAVYNAAGTLTSDANTTYKSNSSKYGGAIYNDESAKASAITGSAFTKNTATLGGGAIYNASVDNTLSLNGAAFGDGSEANANTAANGGAVYNTGRLISDNTTTYNYNKATANGGAIYNAENAQESTISSTFTKNTAASGGGAIYNTSVNNNLILNVAKFGDGTEENANTAANGGAVYNTGKLSTNNNTTFNYNKATASGGAIYNAGTLTSNAATQYVANTAASGGAIYNAEAAKESTVNGTFTKNAATSGGAVYNASSTYNLILGGATFGDGTDANANTATNGGAVYNTGKLTTNNNATFNYNKATSGGAVYNAGTLTSEAESQYVSNTAVSGGAIYNAAGAKESTVNGTFTKNAATSGGAVYNASTTNALILSGATFGDGTNANANTATNGGAVYNAGLLTTNNNASFNYNKATSGGAIYNDENALASTIGASTFTKNAATSGGAVYNAASTNALSLNGATFGDGTEANANTAVNGGAVYNTGLLTTANTTFNFNKAVTAEEAVETSGGAIYNTGTLTSNAGTSYIANTAFQGGAVYNAGTAAASTITGSTFTKNTATDVGGAICNEATNMLTVDSSTFGDGTEANANTAKYAGAIYNSGKLTTQNGTAFNYNKAEIGGAIVNSASGVLTSDNTTYSNNTVTTVGGAVYNLGKFSSSNSTYNSNNATGAYGGAIANYAETEKVTLTGDTFSTNNAVAGGAVFNMEKAQLESTNVTYSSNNAKQGGAIFNYGRLNEQTQESFYGTLKLTGGTLSGNRATNGGAGGAVYNNGLLTSENVTYSSNLAVKSEDGATPGSGGAIYNDANAQESTIKGGSFIGNQASTSGGAIHNVSANGLIIDGVTFGDGTNANANMSVNGGAIYNDNKMTIKGNTNFRTNIAIENGGAIYNNSVLNITPGEGETVTFSGNLSNYDSQAQTAVSNAVYNLNTVNLDGAGNVVTNDSFGGTGTLNKSGTGAFNITATETINPVVSQNVINSTAGTINIDGTPGTVAGLQGTTTLTLADTMTSLNLKGKATVTGKDVTVSVPSVKATATDNVISGFNLNITGTEEKPVVVSVGDGENAASLAIAALSNEQTLGSANINKYTDLSVESNGNLILNPTGGNVVFEAENVNNRAVYLNPNASLTISGSNLNSEGRVNFNNNKIVTADNTAKVNITGGVTHDINMDYSDTDVIYNQTGGAIVNLNNTFFNAQTGSAVENNATLNLNEGAVLVNDNLAVNNANIAINPNTVSEFSELKATTVNSNIKYGDNYIKLNQAHVILNNDYVVSSQNADPETGKVEIGTGTNALKALTINKSKIAENTNINLTGGTLTLNNTADLPATSTIAVDENSVLNLSNDSDVFTIKSTLTGNGTINNNDTVSNFAGNNGGFTGTYNQIGGTTRFLSGSTYFGDGINHNITNEGSVIFDEGVIFLNSENPVVTNVVNSSLAVKTVGSTSDLSTGVATVDPKGLVKVNLTNSDLLLDKYTRVSNTTNAVAVGDDGTGTLAIKNLSMGAGTYSTNNELVTYAPTQDIVISTYNANAAQNVGTVTVGDNFTIENPNSYVTTLNMGKNTELALNITQNGKLNKRELGMSVATQENAYAADNATITKSGNGKIYLSGDNSKFHGNINIKDGEIALNNSTAVVAGDSKYNLSNAVANANILLNPIHNLNENKDMAIAGITLPKNSTANIYNNNEGGTITVTGNTLVDNNSSLNVEASDTITLADTLIGSASNTSDATVSLKAPKIVFNNAVNTPVLLKGQNSAMNLQGDTDVANDFTIQHATLILNGNMNIGGNYRVGSTVNMANGSINTQNVTGDMTVTNNTQYMVDINGLSLQSDKVVVGGRIQGAQSGLNLDVAGINLMFEPKEENTMYQIFEDSYARSGQENDSLSYITSVGNQVIESPVGKYLFMSAGNGRYILSRIAVQPEVQAGQIATQTGLYSNLNAYRMAFANNDTLMTLPKKEREAYLNANRYVDADDLMPNYSADPAADTNNTAFDVDKEGKLIHERYKYPQNTGGGWIRSYGEFEKVRFSNGPEVNNNMYGIYAGVDSKVFDHKHGFKSSYGFYAGYDGSHQTYQGTGIYQNGGTLGVTGTLYKGDFSNSTTLNIGASGSDVSSRTMGTNFWSLRGGIANKSAYNWDLADGRFIIQPHLLMSLTTVNVFPYTVGFAKADGDSIFAFQLAPGLKLAFNTANGWQPYLNCDFNWIMGGASGSTVNYVRLPELSSDPWIEYGLGIQKRWGERFTGYGQAMFRNLGRNGVAFSAGMRWRVGDGE